MFIRRFDTFTPNLVHKARESLWLCVGPAILLNHLVNVALFVHVISRNRDGLLVRIQNDTHNISLHLQYMVLFYPPRKIQMYNVCG